MRFGCKCGHTISDTTDNLPYSARVVADVDVYDYWEAWERTGRGQSLGALSDPMDYEKIIYQCEECGRLYFDDPDDPSRFIAFLPEDKNVMVTGPAEAQSWRGYIYGSSDLGMERGIGRCFTNWNYGTGEEYREFDSYEAMREYFDGKLTELQAEDRVKSAWINKDGETIFRWNLEDTEPVQEKFEIFLTEPERAALENFRRNHVDCRNRYPRGTEGWDYKYEILPGVCGADDRDLRVTCLRCGDSVASIDGKIVDEAAKTAIGDSSKAAMALDLLHDRATRDIRSETISMPHRYYDIAGAVGYVEGLLDALKLFGEEGQLVSLFQHVMARLTDEGMSGYPADLSNLIRNSCEEDRFDWAIEEAWPFVVQALKADFDATGIEWIDEPIKRKIDPENTPRIYCPTSDAKPSQTSWLPSQTITRTRTDT